MMPDMFMDMPKIAKEDALKEIGLSAKETKIFLSLVAIGQCTVSILSKHAGLNRTSTYDLVKSLIEKGLVSYAIKNRIKYFESCSPHQLAFIMNEKLAKINSIIPDLELLSSTVKQRPKIELYDGKEGIKTIMNDIIKTKKPTVVISSHHHVFKLLQYYAPKFIEQRIKHKIFIRALTERTDQTINELRKYDKNQMRETRFIKFTKDIPNAIYIYGNKIALLNLDQQDPHGILIENDNMAKTMLGLFNFVWSFAEKN